MTVRLLAGVSALALALSAASGAMANPQNTFSNSNTTAVESAATANAGGDARATSESFNRSQTAVSNQTLVQTTSGSSFAEGLVSGTLSMNATVAGTAQQNAAGVVQASAQSGFQPQTQQAASIAAIGTVHIGGDVDAAAP